jgi:hypothetical protein
LSFAITILSQEIELAKMEKGKNFIGDEEK